MNTSTAMPPLQHTFWWQFTQHLLPELLHLWNSVCCYGHFAVLPQSAHISITVQVVIQQLSGIGTVGALNLCDEALSNHFLSLKSEQIKLSINHLKELLLMFLKDL